MRHVSIMEHRRYRLLNNRKYKNCYRKRVASQAKRRHAEEDKDYGEHCQQPDMEESLYKLEKEEFLKKLHRTEDQKKKLEAATRNQGYGDSIWLEERRKLLTASNHARICKRRSDASCPGIVKSILYTAVSDNIPSIRHGIDNEKTAIVQLEKQEHVKIEKCGLFIDKTYDFIGASPDGVIGNDVIVEIKCPLSAYNMHPDDAIKNNKISFFKYNKGADEIIVNTKDKWYFQIQGQLRVTQKEMCLFAVWTGDNFPLKTVYVKRDDTFFAQNMENKLISFYFDHLLPELIDPRKTRNMPIRGEKNKNNK